MATANYSPEAGFKAGPSWAQTDLLAADLPGTLADWQGFTALSGTDLTNLAVDDTNGVVCEQSSSGGPPTFYAGGVLGRLTVGDPGITRFDFTVKGYDTGGQTYEFWVYDFNGSAFVSLGTHAGGAPGAFTFTANITTNLSYYTDGSGYLWVLCTANTYGASTAKLIYFVDVMDTYSAAADVELSGTVGASVSTAASGTATISMSGTVAMSATTSVSAGATLALAGTVAMALSTSAAANATRALAGTVAMALSTSAAANTAVELSGTVALQVAATADGAANTFLAGTCALAVTTTATGTHAPGLAGHIALAVSTSASGSPSIGLAGTVAMATSAVAGGGSTPLLTGTVALAVTTTATGTNVIGLSGTVGVSVSTSAAGSPVLGLAGTVTLTVTTDATGYVIYLAYLSIPPSGMRRISWVSGGIVAYLMADGALVYSGVEQAIELNSDFTIRRYLTVYSTEPESPVTPLDQVDVSWTEAPTASVYLLYRKESTEASDSLIATVAGLTYRDGPLPDGTYRYRVRAEDDGGDYGPLSLAQTVTVSSAPDPPSDLAYSWDAPTQTITLTWTASPSADLDAYRVRESDTDGLIDLAGTPAYEGAALNWQRTFSTETGIYAWSLRAVDADGNEEQNIREVVSLPFVDGALSALPAEPLSVAAYNVAGGKVLLDVLYDPSREVNGPGAAFELRVYVNDGAGGAVDFGAPVDTQAMSAPTAVDRFEWTSAQLMDGLSYLWTVRIATAAWPAGLETQNTEEVGAPEAIDDDVPATPTLEAEIV